MKICVGSLSRHKIEAVERAIQALGLDAEVSCMSTSSGVPEQPVGPQACAGARNRAVAAAGNGDLGVGIENGIWWRPGEYADRAVVVVNGRDVDVLAYSDSVVVPVDLAEAAIASGQTVTAGSLEAARSGCDPADPHKIWSSWSSGRTDRVTILADAVRRALTLALAGKS